jgi:hypothetical protein
MTMEQITGCQFGPRDVRTLVGLLYDIPAERLVCMIAGVTPSEGLALCDLRAPEVTIQIFEVD